MENIIKYSQSPMGGTPYVTKFTRVEFTFYIFKLNNICMYRINIPNFDNKCLVDNRRMLYKELKCSIQIVNSKF